MSLAFFLTLLIQQMIYLILLSSPRKEIEMLRWWSRLTWCYCTVWCFLLNFFYSIVQCLHYFTSTNTLNKVIHSYILNIFNIYPCLLSSIFLFIFSSSFSRWAFVTFPTTVNAFYIQQFNSIVIPLAFLNPPHYVERAPVYINYATIALTLAHEALHALDSSGAFL